MWRSSLTHPRRRSPRWPRRSTGGARLPWLRPIPVALQPCNCSQMHSNQDVAPKTCSRAALRSSIPPSSAVVSSGVWLHLGQATVGRLGWMGRMGWRLGRLGRVRPSPDHLNSRLPAQLFAVLSQGQALSIATLLPPLLLLRAPAPASRLHGVSACQHSALHDLGRFTAQVPRRLGLGLGPLRLLECTSIGVALSRLGVPVRTICTWCDERLDSFAWRIGLCS